MHEKLRALESLSLDLEINFGIRLREIAEPLLAFVAASDQMMLETGGSDLSYVKLQTYQKEPLPSGITQAVENFEIALSKHIR